MSTTGYPRAEHKRLSRQCEAMLARLKEGPTSNGELARFSLKYTSRLSDLRAAGYDIRILSRNTKSGVTVYRLVPPSQPSLASLWESQA